MALYSAASFAAIAEMFKQNALREDRHANATPTKSQQATARARAGVWATAAQVLLDTELERTPLEKSAPDMLAALKAIVEFYGWDADDDGEFEVCKKAHAAIRKAEGTSP